MTVNLSHQLFTFQARNTLWLSSAVALGICGLGVAATIQAKTPAQKAILGALITTAATVNTSYIRTQYHRANQMSVSVVNAQLQGDREFQLQAFAPQQQQLALPADIEIEAEEDNQELDPFLDSVAKIPDELPIARNIVLALNKVKGNLMLEFCEMQEGLAFDRYLFDPFGGVQISDVQSKAKDLKVNAALTQEPIISDVSGYIAIDVVKPERVFAEYSDYINSRKTGGFWIPIGVDQITKKVIWINLSDSNSPHLLIGGMTGSGKTEFLRIISLYLSQFYSKEEINLLLIDTKKAAFNEFKGIPHAIGKTVITQPIQAAIALIKLVKVVERRQEIRETAGAKDLDSYIKKTGKTLPRILVIIEEFKDVVDALKLVSPSDLKQLQDAISESMGADIEVGYANNKQMKPRDVLLLAVDRIAQIGRSEGVHLAIATQDPDKKLLDTIISNLPVQVGLKTRSSTESNTLMPNVGADCHKLMGKGDLYLNLPGYSLQRIQSLYASEEYIESVVAQVIA